MLQINNLSTGIGNPTKLLHRSIDVELGEGTLTLLIGPNGVGKSVFLKTLCGLIPAVSGNICILKNQSAQNIHKVSAEIRASLSSILMATPPQIEQMSVFDIVLSGRQRFIQGWRNPSETDMAAVYQAMKRSDVEHLSDTNFAHLSDGLKQKVMLSRCLAQNSYLILLDEPLAFLDYPSRLSFLKLLHNLAQSEKKIIIYSSHDLHLSLQYCDHAICLSQDKFEYFNNPKDLNLESIF